MAAHGWDRDEIDAMLGSLYLMHDGVMPPFAGTNGERAALAAFLFSLRPAGAGQARAMDGHSIFLHNCAMCHQQHNGDPLFELLPSDPATAAEALEDLPNLFPLMPDIKLSAAERTALVRWINTRRGNATHSAGQGGN